MASILVAERPLSTDRPDASGRDDSRGSAAPPAPTPAAPVAIGVAAGVVLVDAAAPSSLFACGLAAAALIASLVWLAIALRRGATMRGRTGWCVVLVVSALAGGLRAVADRLEPPHHVRRCLPADGPALARLIGRVVSPPTVRTPPIRNPLLRESPLEQAQFALAVSGARTEAGIAAAVGRVLVRVDGGAPAVRLGDTVEVTGWTYRFSGQRNPGEPDWSRVRFQQGYDAGLRTNSADLVRVLAPASGFAGALDAGRAALHGLLISPAGAEHDEGAQLLEVMVLGQRSAADQRLYDVFRRTGGIHFLSVSGFHVAVLAGAAWFVFRRVLRRSRRTTALAAGAATLGYVALLEPSAPVLRTAFGAGALMLASAARRSPSPLNALAAAAAATLLANPRELFAPGAQLSYVNATVLLTVVPALYRRMVARRLDVADGEHRGEANSLPALLARWTRAAARGALLVSIVCWAASTPIVLMHFGQFSAWGWLGSIVLAPAVAAIILLSFMSIVFGLCGSLGWAVRGALDGACDALLAIASVFEHLPGALVELAPAPAWLAWGTAALAAGAWHWRRQLTRPVIAGGLVASCFVWAGWLTAPRWAARSDYALCVFAVGDGSAALLAAPGGRSLVVDCGSSRNIDAGAVVAGGMRPLGASDIDLLALTHGNIDHFSGAASLVSRATVRALAVNPGFAERVARLPNAAATVDVAAALTLARGARLSAAGGVVEVLWPPADLPPDAPINDTSLVLRWSGGGRRVLFTGDIEARAISGLLTDAAAGRCDLRADVLVAPHHGEVLSGLTDRLLRAVQPAVVVASNQRERAVLAEAAGVVGPHVRVVQTGGGGAALVEFSAGGELGVRTWRRTP